MGDKFDGALAAGRAAIAGMRGNMDIAEAMQSLMLHETLITKDENENTVLLRAVQNPLGGIMMAREENQSHAHIMQEAIRRSQMTSMLADDARCSKYNDAIKQVLQEHPGATVVDIGTGTGLLAMLAAKAGASHVTAVEMFEPLADLAVDIVRANNLHDKVSVVCASSTDLSADNTGEEDAYVLRERADVLVTEIFDSALLGENCISAIKHAHERLLKEGASVIPARARLFATVISSEVFYGFRNLSKDFPLQKAGASGYCGGGSTGIPVHLDGLTEGRDFEILTEPFEVFEFDFTKRSIPKYRQKSKRVVRTKNGRPDAILTWWELDLTENGDIVYSTKPGAENWQDHWLQVVYPFSDLEHKSPTDSTIGITMEHDDTSFAFAYGVDEEPSVICQCGFHSIMTPYRIHEVSDRNLELLSSQLKMALENICDTTKAGSHIGGAIRCIDVSDNSVCAVLASRVECERAVDIYSVEEDNEISSFLFSRIADNMKTADNNVFVEYDPLSAFIERELANRDSAEDWEGFDIIISEPFTRAMHAFPTATFGNLMAQRLALSALLKDNFRMVPSVGRIQAQLVRFPPHTLQRSFKTIETVQGLDVRPYSRLLQDEEWDQSQRRLSLPLFQYNVIQCSEKTCVATVEFCVEDDKLHPNPSITWIPATSSGDIDGIALSVEYDGAPANRIARSELIWLSQREKGIMSSEGGITLECDFLRDTGVWEICVEASQR